MICLSARSQSAPSAARTVKVSKAPMTRPPDRSVRAAPGQPTDQPQGTKPVRVTPRPAGAKHHAVTPPCDAGHMPCNTPYPPSRTASTGRCIAGHRPHRGGARRPASGAAPQPRCIRSRPDRRASGGGTGRRRGLKPLGSSIQRERAGSNPAPGTWSATAGRPVLRAQPVTSCGGGEGADELVDGVGMSSSYGTTRCTSRPTTSPRRNLARHPSGEAA